MSSAKTLTKLFNKSPIKPMQEHMAYVLDCCNLLPSFFNAASSQEWEQAEKIFDEISRLEGEADTAKRSIRVNLPKSLFMPIGRNDLLTLLSRQDMVANCAKDISGTVLGRKMAIPQSISETIHVYLEACLKSVKEAHTIVNELDELIETGFGGREIEWIEKLITRLDELESETDDIQIKMRAQLLAVEKELPPIEVMFLYKTIELIGNLADYAQKVGDQTQIIVAR